MLSSQLNAKANIQDFIINLDLQMNKVYQKKYDYYNL